MNPGMRMLMLANRQNEQTQNRYDRAEYSPHSGGYGADRGNDTSMTYDPHMGGYGGETRMGYDMPESRRYKNGRFAPARYEGDNDVSMRYEPSMNYGGEHQKQKMKIGFAGGEEESDVMPFSQMTAEKWARSMENDDGTTGPHWSIEQVKQVMAQKGVTCDPWEFYAALNAIYSDYGKVLKKHGVGDKLDIYIDMAKAFIDDKDAQPDKLARYYQYVVKH